MRLTVDRQASTAKWLPWVCLLCIYSHFIVPVWGLASFTTMLVCFTCYCAIKERKRKAWTYWYKRPCSPPVAMQSEVLGWWDDAGVHTHICSSFFLSCASVCPEVISVGAAAASDTNSLWGDKRLHIIPKLCLSFSLFLSLYQSKTMTKAFTEPEMVLNKWLLVIFSRVESQLWTLTSGLPERERQNMSCIFLLSPHNCASRTKVQDNTS